MRVGRHVEDKALFSPGAFPSFYNDPDFDLRACRDVDPELFFPEQGYLTASEAKRVCNRCPIKQRCKTWALSRPWTEVHGVWGGMTQGDRKREQHRGKANCPRCGRLVKLVSNGTPPRHMSRTTDGWCS